MLETYLGLLVLTLLSEDSINIYKYIYIINFHSKR